MKVSAAIIGGIVLLSNAAIASTEKNNPFLPPSERIDKDYEEQIATDEQCEATGPEGSAETLADLLEKEITFDGEPQFHPNVLGKWKREDIENSRYIGEVNNHKVYFHNGEGHFFALDLSKADLPVEQ